MNNHITFAERKISSTRTTLVPVSAEREALEKYLTGEMLDAEREIASTFLRRTAQMGYASMGDERVDKSRAEDVEGCECGACPECKAYRYKLDLLKTLKKNLRNAEYGILLDIAVFAFTPANVSMQRAMTPERVIEIYMKALNEWCALRGWHAKNI